MAPLWLGILCLLLPLCISLASEVHSKSRRRREWIIPPTKLTENVDYTKREYIAIVRSDNDVHGSVTYQLLGNGADRDPINLFIVNPDNGMVRVTGIVDREKIHQYNLTGVARYRNGTLAETDIQLKVVVLDQNDNGPKLKAHQSGTVPESSKEGTHVMRVSAEDADEAGTINTKIAFSILNQKPAGLGTMFSIDRNTGDIKVKEPTLDRETRSSYVLTVQGVDLDGAENGYTGTGTIRIDILDINDNLPTLEKDEYTGIIEEDAVDVEVMRIKALDKDIENTENWQAVFEIAKGNDDGIFTIETDPVTNEGILKLVKPVDYEAVREMDLELKVSNVAPFDNGSGTSSNAGFSGTGSGMGSSQSGHGANAGLNAPGGKGYPIKIKVKNKPDGPGFKPKVKHIPVSESKEKLGVPVVIGSYPAVDGDTGQTANNVRYAKGYDPDNWLAIDEDTAEIKLTKVPDRESEFLVNGTYYAMILCMTQDVPSKTVTGTIALNVEDSNDHCPKLTSTHQSVCSGEDMVNITAFDEDVHPNGAPLSFVLIEEETRGEWQLESINSTTVGVRPKTALWPGIYELTVEIKDMQGLGCEDKQKLQLMVCTCGDAGICGSRAEQHGSSTNMGAPAIGLVLLGLAFLLLAALLVLFCQCGAVGEFTDLPYDAKEYLIPYHTEGKGEDKRVPLLGASVVMIGDEPDIQTINVGAKSSMQAQIQTMNSFYGDRAATLHVEMEEGMAQMYQSAMRRSLHSSTFRQEENDIYEGMALPDVYLHEYYAQKASCAAQNSCEKDSLLVYGYEGQGSPAGSVGCCSLLESKDDLEFLNDLGSKFSTLAEICVPPTLHPCQPKVDINASVNTFNKAERSVTTSMVEVVKKAPPPPNQSSVTEVTRTVSGSDIIPCMQTNQMLVLQQPMYYMVEQQVPTVLLAEMPPVGMAQGMYVINGNPAPILTHSQSSLSRDAHLDPQRFVLVQNQSGVQNAQLPQLHVQGQGGLRVSNPISTHATHLENVVHVQTQEATGSTYRPRIQTHVQTEFNPASLQGIERAFPVLNEGTFAASPTTSMQTQMVTEGSPVRVNAWSPQTSETENIMFVQRQGIVDHTQLPHVLPELQKQSSPFAFCADTIHGAQSEIEFDSQTEGAEFPSQDVHMQTYVETPGKPQEINVSIQQESSPKNELQIVPEVIDKVAVDTSKKPQEALSNSLSSSDSIGFETDQATANQSNLENVSVQQNSSSLTQDMLSDQQCLSDNEEEDADIDKSDMFPGIMQTMAPGVFQGELLEECVISENLLENCMKENVSIDHVDTQIDQTGKTEDLLMTKETLNASPHPEEVMQGISVSNLVEEIKENDFGQQMCGVEMGEDDPGNVTVPLQIMEEGEQSGSMDEEGENDDPCQDTEEPEFEREVENEDEPGQVNVPTDQTEDQEQRDQLSGQTSETPDDTDQTGERTRCAQQEITEDVARLQVDENTEETVVSHLAEGEQDLEQQRNEGEMGEDDPGYLTELIQQTEEEEQSSQLEEDSEDCDPCQLTFVTDQAESEEESGQLSDQGSQAQESDTEEMAQTAIHVTLDNSLVGAETKEEVTALDRASDLEEEEEFVEIIEDMAELQVENTEETVVSHLAEGVKEQDLVQQKDEGEMGEDDPGYLTELIQQTEEEEQSSQLEEDSEDCDPCQLTFVTDQAESVEESGQLSDQSSQAQESDTEEMSQTAIHVTLDNSLVGAETKEEVTALDRASDLEEEEEFVEIIEDMAELQVENTEETVVSHLAEGVKEQDLEQQKNEGEMGEDDPGYLTELIQQTEEEEQSSQLEEDHDSCQPTPLPNQALDTEEPNFENEVKQEDDSGQLPVLTDQTEEQDQRDQLSGQTSQTLDDDTDLEMIRCAKQQILEDVAGMQVDENMIQTTVSHFAEEEEVCDKEQMHLDVDTEIHDNPNMSIISQSVTTKAEDKEAYNEELTEIETDIAESELSSLEPVATGQLKTETESCLITSSEVAESLVLSSGGTEGSSGPVDVTSGSIGAVALSAPPMTEAPLESQQAQGDVAPIVPRNKHRKTRKSESGPKSPKSSSGKCKQQ